MKATKIKNLYLLMVEESYVLCSGIPYVYFGRVPFIISESHITSHMVLQQKKKESRSIDKRRRLITRYRSCAMDNRYSLDTCANGVAFCEWHYCGGFEAVIALLILLV
jgi:hypothetical protein